MNICMCTYLSNPHPQPFSHQEKGAAHSKGKELPLKLLTALSPSPLGRGILG